MILYTYVRVLRSSASTGGILYQAVVYHIHVWIPNCCVTALLAVKFHLTWRTFFSIIRGRHAAVCTRALVRVCELISRECRDWARPLLWMSIIVWMSGAGEEGEVGRRMWSSQTPAQRKSSPVASWSCHCASLLIHSTLRRMVYSGVLDEEDRRSTIN